jgi:hypothetical protein
MNEDLCHSGWSQKGTQFFRRKIMRSSLVAAIILGTTLVSTAISKDCEQDKRNIELVTKIQQNRYND